MKINCGHSHCNLLFYGISYEFLLLYSLIVYLFLVLLIDNLWRDIDYSGLA